MTEKQFFDSLGTFLKRLISVLVSVWIIGLIILRICGYKVMYIATDSMEPTLKTNQFVIAQAIDGDDIEVGDIATYKYFGKIYTITHRVIEADDTYLIFKGDNNEFADKPVSRDRVIYKVIAY